MSNTATVHKRGPRAGYEGQLLIKEKDWDYLRGSLLDGSLTVAEIARLYDISDNGVRYYAKTKWGIHQVGEPKGGPVPRPWVEEDNDFEPEPEPEPTPAEQDAGTVPEPEPDQPAPVSFVRDLVLSGDEQDIIAELEAASSLIKMLLDKVEEQDRLYKELKAGQGVDLVNLKQANEAYARENNTLIERLRDLSNQAKLDHADAISWREHQHIENVRKREMSRGDLRDKMRAAQAALFGKPGER